MTHPEPFDSGARIGTDAADHIAECAERYCRAERDRIILTNEPRLNTLEAEGNELTKRRSDLADRLRHITPPPNPRGPRRQAAWYWTVGAVLATAAFGFAVIGLEPYRLGMVGLLYCLGIAVVTPFAVDEFLNAWNTGAMLKAAITVVFAAVIIGGALLASVRGDLLARSVGDTNPAVVIEDESTPEAKPQPSFYETTEVPLRLLMLFFALAIDLAGGVAFHRARGERDPNEAELARVTAEIQAVRARISEIIFEVTALRNEAATFETSFWRDFYRGMLTQSARNAVRKGIGLALLLMVVWPAHSYAEDHQNWLVALDLSGSEGAIGADGKTAFDKNVGGVTRLMGTLPPGTRVTVIGITEDSIANPTPLFSAQLSAEPDRFGDRLRAARTQLVRAWRTRASHLQPSAGGTDIIGALFLASDMLRAQGQKGRNTLVIFSDMRNASIALNLEARIPVTRDSLVAELAVNNRIADLRGTTVEVLGANGGGMSPEQWQGIRDFWLAYLAKAGARCVGYSMLVMPAASR